ncbi:hypothetical protein PF006_g22136 [Phytophthora fragariae]|uniref:Peptidase S74 domain-containing protein n=1 Tax=Phytophthora fragariae TaxID=53985 RepID=A0A6A3RUU3_9STRA|nr:hypothetical protein PF006_g22136 [Phytophthora fragariae]KAE9182121.1 hypothetical protein PF004_g24339 [Phytophthora fragariae]
MIYTIASSTDVICLNAAGDSAIGYSTWGKANVSLNGNLAIQSNNNFSDGSTGFNTGLYIQGGTTTNPIGFAFQLSTGDSTTSTNSVVMGTISSSDLKFMCGNSSKMTISAATGRVGIGTSSPLYGLHVMTTATVTIDGGGSGVAYFKVSGGLVSTAGPLSSVAVGITCSGALVASTGCYVWSDERLKKDWAELSDDVSDSMLNVKPMLYRYKTDPDSASLQVGYSAQSLLSAGIPHGITFHKSDGLAVEDPETDMKDISYSVDYGKMTCLLHKLFVSRSRLMN